MKRSLVTQEPFVQVTCPALKDANQVTYSLGNIDHAYTIGSGILRVAHPDQITGTDGMDQIIPCFFLFLDSC